MAVIKINADIWDDSSEEERTEILEILRESGLIKDGDELEGDPDTPALFADDESADGDFTHDFEVGELNLSPCKSACKAARDAARASCGVKYPFSSRKRRRCREGVERALVGCRAACDHIGG